MGLGLTAGALRDSGDLGMDQAGCGKCEKGGEVEDV